MNGGKIVASGDAKDILEDEELLKGANLVVPDTIKLLNLIRTSSISKEVEDEVCQLIFHK